MADEVFDETLVARAIDNGVAERIGPLQNFTFKVKKGKYQEWQAILAAQDSRNTVIEEEPTENEEITEKEEDIEKEEI
jgi:hypothetical protein